MLLFALAWLAGDASLLLSFLPHLLWLLIFLGINLLAIIIAPAGCKLFLYGLTAFNLSLIWGVFNVQLLLNNSLPVTLQNQTVTAIGTIDSIPEQKEYQTNYIFTAKKIFNQQNTFNKTIHIRLSWYFPPTTVKAGQEWQLQVRLKAPINNSNLGSFNYQQWLFAQKILVVGYVQNTKHNYLLSAANTAYSLDSYREYIAQQIAKSLAGKPLLGLIQALAVGVRGNITDEQWQVLRGTGTNHLFAIAGLHIGFMTGFAFWLTSFIWRRLGNAPLYIPTPIISVVVALLIAILYSALAGFALPTQRAVIMIGIFLLATLLRKKIPLWHAYSIALIVILIWDPFAVYTASFWMSFSAVALIIYGTSGRLGNKNGLWHWLYPQYVIAIGLIPISLLFFQQYSFVSLVANLIAIPWIGFMVLPLSFIGSLLITVIPAIGKLFLLLAEYLLNLVWLLLTDLSRMNSLQWIADIHNPWLFFTAMVAVILLLAPRGVPARWLFLLWLLPILVWEPAKPPLGSVWFTVFNINPGVAVLIRTRSSVLLYESGIKAIANSTIILPYLQYLRIKKINTLIVNLSASNNEDIFNLMALLPVEQVFLNTSHHAVQGHINLCQPAMQWQTDNVIFTVQAINNAKRNICTLVVKREQAKALITDLAQIKTLPLSLNEFIPVDILISTYNTKNISEFLNILQAKTVYFSGKNSPKNLSLLITPAVYSTAKEGMISFAWKDLMKEKKEQ